MGVVNTTYTFSGTDTITSSKLNNIIDDTTFTSDAIQGTTLEVASGQLKIRSQGITSNELSSDLASTLLPSGAVMPFARNSAPTGWLIADGSLISTGGINALLFGAIGYTYGGSGGSFNLPDLRGIFVRGSGSQVISGGTFAGTFAQKQAHMFQDHGHAGYTDVQGWHNHSGSTDTHGGHTHGVPTGNSEGDNTTNATNGGATANSFQTQAAGAHSHTLHIDGSGNHSHHVQTYGANSGTTGGETRPANIALLYCIKL
jgi:microcystin-dependent protein